MKKLLLLTFLFVTLAFYGQEEKTVNLNVKTEMVKNNRGYTYLGNGMYSIEIDNVFWASKKSIIKMLLKKVQTIANNLDANYKILNNSTKKRQYSDYRSGVSTFELRTKIGNNLIINKEEAKKEIISLIKFLDIGIITQEEFDKKAIYLKRVLLGN